MSRERLPDRRPNETQEFERDGIRITMTVGYKSNGDVGELFLSADRSNSTLDVLMSDAAIIASIALQNGTTIRQHAHAIKRDCFGLASAPIGAARDRISTPEVL
jgi:hypothetical protein